MEVMETQETSVRKKILKGRENEAKRAVAPVFKREGKMKAALHCGIKPCGLETSNHSLSHKLGSE